MTTPKRFKVTTQDAYNYAASKFFADQQLAIVLKLNGNLEEDLFEQTIHLTMDLEPILGCQFVENGNEPFWERRNDLENTKLSDVVKADPPEDALETFVSSPIRADLDPLVRARIFRGRNTDTLCIKINHSVCDGGGLKEYVFMLSNIYNTLVSGKECIVLPNLGRRDQSQILQLAKDTKNLAVKGFPQPTWTLLQKAGTEPLHCFRIIPKPRFEEIKKYAQNKSTSANDVLLAALFRAFFVLNNTPADSPMIMQVSIDLRRYLSKQKAEAICNLSGALYVALERKVGEEFDGTLARVSAAMSRLKENYPGLESAAGLEYLASQGYIGLEKYLEETSAIGRKFNVTFPLLSNFGVLSLYGFGELKVINEFISSPIMYLPGFMLGVSTFNDEMTFSIGYCGKENSQQINRFLEIYVAELPLM